ncbi:outer membrane assembly protein AsmA, partial [Salmonella enterica subsp. enterica serovar Infantis]
HSWNGKAHVDMSNSRLEVMIFLHLVQQGVERSGGDALQSQENMDNATRLDRFSTDLTLNKGTMTLDDMFWQSSLLALTVSG